MPNVSEIDVINDLIAKIQALPGVTSVEHTVYKTLEMRVYIDRSESEIETEYRVYDLQAAAMEQAPTVYFNILPFNGTKDDD